MSELIEFGWIVLVVAGGFTLAFASSRLTERLSIPGPAVFLLVAAIAGSVFPRLHDAVEIRAVERVATVALVLILFEGGMHIGLRRFRSSVVPIATLGVVGTFATAAAMAAATHLLIGLSWQSAALVGAAIAPTDPAAVFSVLGRREVVGRSGTILEGESGANDPVGIALMLALLQYVSGGHTSAWHAGLEFVLSLAVGTAVGVAGGLQLGWLARKVTLPSAALYPLRTLAVAGVVYGTATVLHGSGFLAVFVAGILFGDVRAPYKAEIERFHASLASLAEVVAFAALGLSIQLSAVGWDWLRGSLLALVLVLVVRPLVVGPLLLPARLRMGERIFVLWGGLKGAVPILLGTLVLLEGVPDAQRIYLLVFVVVAFSVVVQGTTMPALAERMRIPMRRLEDEPWNLAIRLREEPQDVERLVVRAGARAAGTAIRDLPLGESWIALVLREGRPLRPGGSTELAPGDEVVLLADEHDREALSRVFEGAQEASAAARTPARHDEEAES